MTEPNPSITEATVADHLQFMSRQIREKFPFASPMEPKWLLQKVAPHGIPVSLRSVWSGVSPQIRDGFQALIQRRLGGEPLQYILGTQHFLEMELAVGPGVFIPRMETEDLLRELKVKMPQLVTRRCLDMCAGSGAFGIGLTRLYPVAEVHFVENSIHALPYLIRNVETYVDSSQTLSRIFHMEAMAFVRDGVRQYDVIVCNPPYVGTQERTKLPVDVLQEPSQALFAGKEGMDFYPHLVEMYDQLLMPGGVMLFEHHESHQGVLADWLRRHWKNIAALEGIRDMSGRPRGLLVTKGLEVAEKKA